MMTRILNMIAWGRKTTGNDAGNVQMLQARCNAGEVGDNRPRIAEFGFTSMPPDGSDVVLLFLGGDRTNGIVIGTGDQKTRMKNLSPGESALYDSIGKHVYLKSGEIEIDAKGQPVNIVNASTVTVNASGSVTVNAGGTAKVTAPSIILESTGESLKNLLTTAFSTLFNGHTHHHEGDEGETDIPTQQSGAEHATTIVQAE